MLPRIAVVLCTHNGEKFLSTQLESLTKQTFQPDEIVISDDASTDGTRALLESFARDSAIPVKLVCNNPPLGFADNFLSACTHVQADWIAFCDQDDIWHANKLEACAAAMEPDVVMITHRARLVDKHDQPIGDFDQNIVSSRRVGPLSYDLWGTFWGFTIVFRRNLLDLHDWRLRFADYIYKDGRSIAHDRWISFLSQLTGSRVELADRLADYRQHDKNIFGGRKERKVAKQLAKKASEENLRYLAATRQMRQIVEQIDQRAAASFPKFDRTLALAFVDSGIAQLEARESVYLRRGIRGFSMVLKNLGTGKYRHIATGKMRWRSVLRDIHFVITQDV
jgi:glycosyltransferase involved in cell wall biosynthesis